MAWIGIEVEGKLSVSFNIDNARKVSYDYENFTIILVYGNNEIEKIISTKEKFQSLLLAINAAMTK